MGKIIVERFRKKKDEKRHWRRQKEEKKGKGEQELSRLTLKK